MFEPTVVTRDQAILGFMRIKYPNEVAETEKLVDDLVKSGVTGITRAASPSTAKESEPRGGEVDKENL